MAIIAVGIVIAFLIVILMNVGGYVSQVMGTILYGISVPIMYLLDFVQIVFRKLAGLGTVYTAPRAIGASGYVEQNGDILLSLITNQTILQVFLAMLIVSVVILIIATIVQMIRTEYTTEGSKNSKTTIIGTALKAFAYFFITPIACVFGIIVANYLLKALDAATAQSGSSTISGSVFLAAASDANRIRTSNEEGYWVQILFQDYDLVAHFDDEAKSFTGSYATWEDSHFGLGGDKQADANVNREIVAGNIDTAFAMGSQLTAVLGADMGGTVYTIEGHEKGMFPFEAIYYNWISYDNPMTVARYYYMMDINYFVLYVGLCLCIVTLFKACFGMIKRMYTATMLFMISPGVIGIWPLDGGAAFNKWRSAFIGSVLSAYGVILALNLYFDIVGVIKHIFLFNPYRTVDQLVGIFAVLRPGAWGLVNTINRLIQAIMIIVGALMVGEFSSTISSFIGATDGLKEGGEMTGKVAGAVGKGTMVAVGGGMLAMKGMKAAGKGIAGGVKNFGSNFKAGFENGQEAGQNKFGSFLRGAGKAVATPFVEGGKKIGATAIGAVTARTSDEVREQWAGRWADRKEARADRKEARADKKRRKEIADKEKENKDALAELRSKKDLTAEEQAEKNKRQVELMNLGKEKKKMEERTKERQERFTQRSERKAEWDSLGLSRMKSLEAESDVGAGFFFRQTTLGKNLNTATAGLFKGFGGDTEDKLKKEASGKSDAAKEYIEAVDGYNASVKQAKTADETGRAKATVAALNKIAEQKELDSIARTAVVASLPVGSKVGLDESTISELTRALAQGYNGSSFSTDDVNKKLSEMKIEGKISEEVANSMASKMADAVQSSLKEMKQKDDKTVAAIEELGNKLLAAMKGKDGPAKK